MKGVVKKYLDRPTDIYHLVDEEFLNSFPEKQRMYMLIQYYDQYTKYCDRTNISALPMNAFLKNADNCIKIYSVADFLPHLVQCPKYSKSFLEKSPIIKSV